MRLEMRLGDGVAGMLSLPSKSVDCFITSPPYNRGKNYGAVNDNRPWPEYLAWVGEVARAMDHCLSDEGSLFFNFGSCPTQPWSAWDVANVFRQHFQLQNTIVWVQSIAIGDRTFGHYQPVNGHRFLNDCYETIFHFTRTGKVSLSKKVPGVGVPYTDKSNQKRWKEGAEGLRCRGNTWYLPYETVQSSEEKGHACPFPMELPRRCLKLHGLNKIRLACDPFGGAATTLLACAELGVPCVGWELDFQTFCGAAQRVRETGR